MEFVQIGKKERYLLLLSLDLNPQKLECHVCGEKVDYETCCIMPPVNGQRATIVCGNSGMCMLAYFEILEEEMKNEKRKEKP